MLSPTYHKILAAFLATAGVLLVALGARTFMRVEGLTSRAAVAPARLTEVRERGDSDTGIVARYEFEVGGRRFHHQGLFGEGSADITAAQAADPSRTIEVRYLPEDPSVNEPVSDVTPSATRQLVAVGIGLVMLGAAAFRWMVARRMGTGRGQGAERGALDGTAAC